MVFELGYRFGAFDSLDDRGIYTANDALVIVAENGVELFSDIDIQNGLIMKRQAWSQKKKYRRPLPTPIKSQPILPGIKMKRGRCTAAKVSDTTMPHSSTGAG